MFLYALNHLVGYDAWTMDELKGYGSAKSGGYTTICHGLHPLRALSATDIPKLRYLA
jgi:dihydroxyacetone synthase